MLFLVVKDERLNWFYSTYQGLSTANGLLFSKIY